MIPTPPCLPRVVIIDDDADLRDALAQLVGNAGLATEAYADGAAFLATGPVDQPGCLLLDVALPGMSGLELQRAMAERGIMLPIVFMTGHGDIPTAVRAVQEGALEFLEKPVRGEVLLRAVRNALTVDRARRQVRGQRDEIRQRHARLSLREREVMARVASGASNKEIARDLDLSPRTVEVHRTHVMHKMGADNLAELVMLATHCRD